MGGQVCVFYGAAEFSRDLDLLASSRPVVQAAPSSGLLAILQALREEENEVRHRDRLYWEPLKRELEDLRRKRREHGQTKL